MPGTGLNNLALSDLEFESERLVKVRGARPSYMNGDQLLDVLGQIGVLLGRAIATPAPKIVPQKSDAQKLIPGLLGVDNRLRDLSSGLKRRGEWQIASYVNREISALVEIMNTIPPIVEEPSVSEQPDDLSRPADPVAVPDLTVYRNGEPTTLRDCPPGPFVFEGVVSVKLPEPMQNGNAFAYHLADGDFFMGGRGGHARDMLMVQPVRFGAPRWPHPAPDDWTLDDTATADEILLLLGEPGSASKEPGADWKRDRLAQIVRNRVDAAVAQEREGCAFAAECHSGFGDPASIEACAALVRERGEEEDECVHLQKPRYAAIMQSLHDMAVALEARGLAAPGIVHEYRRAVETARRLSANTLDPPELRPNTEEAALVDARRADPMFAVGDEVMRVFGGRWLGMDVGDRGKVTEVVPGDRWNSIRIEGYFGLYSEFRFRLAADVDRETCQGEAAP